MGVVCLLVVLVSVLLYVRLGGSSASDETEQKGSQVHLVQYVLGSSGPGKSNVSAHDVKSIKQTETVQHNLPTKSEVNSLEKPYAFSIGNSNSKLQEVVTEPLPTFEPSKELFVRSVYFDDRPRDGHKNSSVFLVMALRNITNDSLIVGCQVGRTKAKAFEVTLIGETPFWRSWFDNSIDHEEVIVTCYDLPVKNGSDAYISYRGLIDKAIHLAASERPLMIPTPRLPPVSEESKKYNLTVVTCAKIFSTPPWLEKWLTYQKTIGVDHVHFNAEDSFQKNGEMDKPYIVEALNSGFLSINIWVEWLSVKEVWYHNQGLMYEDCAYRFRGTYDYMVLLDTDDFFTPRVSGENKIHYYIHKYCSAPAIGSCKLKWIEYYPDHYGLTNASDADGNMTRRLGNYSHYIQDNPKSLHKTKVVLDAATHYAIKMVNGYRIERVPQGVAYVAHVRKNKTAPKWGLRLGLPSSKTAPKRGLRLGLPSSKTAPKRGLRLGLPSSSATHEHIILTIVFSFVLFCCMCVNQ